jgi:Mrp family chromosome partitioning ATPase
MLSRLVDSVVLVVRSHVTEKPLALEARRRLLRVNARILGIVINDVPPKTASEEYDLMYESYGEPPAAGAVG